MNSDGAEEVWIQDGLGNTANAFNLVAWVGDGLRAVVDPGADNPMLIGWGMSGGATLWCADANGDGRTDIVRQRFSRDADGDHGDEVEAVFELDDGRLRRTYEGPPRTELPGTVSDLVCGALSR